MALDILGPTKRAAIHDKDLPLFQMLKDFEIEAPQFEIIWERFYQNPSVDVLACLAEIRKLRDAYISSRSKQVIRDKKVRA